MSTTINKMYPYDYRTPDGRVYIFITETDPISIRVNIGRAGTSVAAWAHALMELVNTLLHHVSVQDVMLLLQEISTSNPTMNTNGYLCKSTPEAVAYAFTEYLQQKRRETKT